MSGGRICGVEQVFVGTRIAMNILLPGFNLFTVVQLKKSSAEYSVSFNRNHLKQKNRLRGVYGYSFFNQWVSLFVQIEVLDLESLV